MAKNSTKEKEVKKNKKEKAPKQKVKKENYFVGIRKELEKVKWPSKAEVLKYTFATVVFVIILVIFFVLLNLVMSLIKGRF